MQFRWRGDLDPLGSALLPDQDLDLEVIQEVRVPASILHDSIPYRTTVLLGYTHLLEPGGFVPTILHEDAGIDDVLEVRARPIDLPLGGRLPCLDVFLSTEVMHDTLDDLLFRCAIHFSADFSHCGITE